MSLSRVKYYDRNYDKVLSRLSRDLGVDMSDVLERAEKYANSIGCYSFGDLDHYAHGALVDSNIAVHLEVCEQCRGTVGRMRRLSLSLNPRKSWFKRLRGKNRGQH
jgi:hypothetical protein